MDAQAQIIPSQQELAVYRPFRSELANLKAQNASFIFDYESKKGNTEARSHIHKLRQSKAAIEKARKAEKAESLNYGRKVDAEAAEIIGEIDAMIEVHAKPLAEIEEREKQRIAAIRARIDGISKHQECRGHDAAEIDTAILALKAITIDESFAELQLEAAKAKEAALTAQEAELPIAIKREAEAAELERLRREAEERAQRDREERIRQEAADAARREAEAKAEQERQATEQKAQAEREAVEHAAREVEEAAAKRELQLKLDAEKAQREKAEAERREAIAVEAERQRVQQEAAAKAAADAKREANKKHRATIKEQAITALRVFLTIDDAEKVFEAIASRAVPHLNVAY